MLYLAKPLKFQFRLWWLAKNVVVVDHAKGLSLLLALIVPVTVKFACNMVFLLFSKPAQLVRGKGVLLMILVRVVMDVDVRNKIKNCLLKFRKEWIQAIEFV